MIFKMYKFNNVSDLATVLTNLRDIASINDWVIDKDDIVANQELYIHSTGNGLQNLYFSIKGFVAVTSPIMYGLHVAGNTGFDNSKAWNNQPNKWNNVTGYYSLPMAFPLITQYIFITNSGIFVTVDCNYTYVYYGTTYNQRNCCHLYIGSVENYKQDEIQGNIINCLGRFYNGFTSAFQYANYTKDDGIYFLNKYFSNTDLRPFYRISSFTYSYDRGGSDYSSYNLWGINLASAVNKSNFTNKTTLLKHIIQVAFTDAGYNYFFPIGEFPVYECKHYPLYITGQEVLYGGRKFVMLPLLRYGDTNGLAVEIEQ